MTTSLINAPDYLCQYQKLIIAKCENMFISIIKSLATHQLTRVFEPWPATQSHPTGNSCRAGEMIAACHGEMIKLNLWPSRFSELSLARIIKNIFSLQSLLETFVPQKSCCQICSLPRLFTLGAQIRYASVGPASLPQLCYGRHALLFNRQELWCERRWKTYAWIWMS